MLGPRKGREDRGAAGNARPGMAPSAAILDAAFHKAYKATPHGATALDRSRRRALLKIVRTGAVVVRHLRAADKRFRTPELTDFEKTLIADRFGRGTLERSRRRLERAIERIRGLLAEEQRALRKASSREAFGELVRRFYGRVASFTREVDPDLVILAEITKFLKVRPQLDPLTPTVVIAGFPNVGKSSLVEKLSSARPKVAEYPFTTLSLEVGHADLGFDRLQILDTPGVLDRSGQSSRAEREAEVAVEHAATLVVFLIDPTESCGYPLPDQLRLLARWREELPNVPILVVATKADLGPSPGDWLRISAKTGEGVDALRDWIGRELRMRRAQETPADAIPGVQDI
ncbi:MAG: 50S ribosome-binding GTPase [Thermoplasmata archaeon]|nr:50S ribosome-binding GTPase [Thermoplasmata archaeon]